MSDERKEEIESPTDYQPSYTEEEMEKSLNKDSKRHLKTADIPKGFLQKLSTSNGLPNLTAVGYGRGATKIPFTYEGFSLYAGDDRLSGQLKKIFYKNKIFAIVLLKIIEIVSNQSPLM